MFSKVRKFLRDRSSDWLNTEVNKDLLQNLTANITSTPKTQDINSALVSSGSWGDLNQPQDEVKRSQTKSDANNNLPLMTDDCSLNIVKGTPHWRRIYQVFQSLDTAPENATYNQLIEYVKETTGKGCSRKLISKWKKQNTSHKFPDHNNDYAARPKLSGINSLADQHLEKSPSAIAFSPTSTASTLYSFQFTETSNHSTKSDLDLLSTDNCSLKTKKLMTDVRANGCSPLITVKTWSYLTAAGLMVGLVGCEILPLNNRPTENTAFASVTTPLPPLSPTPETRKNRLEPSNIKIELTLSNPQDLKVRPGDKVSAGQTLSDRRSERNRLQAKKKQLQLSLEKLNLPLTPIPQPKPIPEISTLPPVFYAEEEAEIKLKQQKLTEANRAIALAQKKIDSLNQLHASPLSREGSALGGFPDLKQLPWTEGDLKQGSAPNIKLILEHEQANLKNLETAKQSAQIQLEVQESKLTTAKENRAYIEYQRQLEQSRRAIALEQQHQALQRTESERQILLAEREYSQAQIETQIQEIDYQIEQLSTVKAPYEGTIKKVKWTGQSDHNLTALVTLAVTSDRSTIANSRAKSVNSQQSTVISDTESIDSQQ
jgi:biotin carboxyl carrier protein